MRWNDGLLRRKGVKGAEMAGTEFFPELHAFRLQFRGKCVKAPARLRVWDTQIRWRVALKLSIINYKLTRNYETNNAKIL